MKTLIRCLGSAAAGVALVCLLGVGTPASAQQVTNQIAQTDFDPGSYTAGWDYGYFYPNLDYTNGTWLVNRAYSDPLIDPTGTNLCIRYEFTNAPYFDFESTNANNYGTGFGAPVIWNRDPAIFTGTNLEDYIFEFDARVEGLVDGQTTANCEMQFQWQSGGVNIYQQNFAVNPGSNWTHYSFLLSDRTGTGGNPGTLSNWVYCVENWLIGDLTFNVNMHHPNPEFGWDDYNVVLVDNVKLFVISGPPPVEPPKFVSTILEWNLDDKPVWGSGWGGYNWSQNSYLPTFTYSVAAAGYGVGGSNAWILTMDNSQLAPPNTPQWAGGGTGANGPADLSLFSSGDLHHYRLTFDARVEGLDPAVEMTTCAMQVFLDSPYYTSNNNMRIDFAIPAGTNWTTTTYTFNQGSIGFGSRPIFATNAIVTGLRIQNQIENAASTDWGYDTDNVLVIDNIKIERIYTNSAPISITPDGLGNVTVTWPTPISAGTLNLQSASSLAGPWTNITPAPTSPYTEPVGTGPKYFRTQFTP